VAEEVARSVHELELRTSGELGPVEEDRVELFDAVLAAHKLDAVLGEAGLRECPELRAPPAEHLLERERVQRARHGAVETDDLVLRRVPVRADRRGPARMDVRGVGVSPRQLLPPVAVDLEAVERRWLGATRRAFDERL